jgi:hypothetical protein
MLQTTTSKNNNLIKERDIDIAYLEVHLFVGKSFLTKRAGNVPISVSDETLNILDEFSYIILIMI